MGKKDVENQKYPTHNLRRLRNIDKDLFTIQSPFSFDDARYELYPNLGWLECDYERVLELDLNCVEDMTEFRAIAAVMIWIASSHPQHIKLMSGFAHFEKIIEFMILEGDYYLLGVDCVKVIETLRENKVISTSSAVVLIISAPKAIELRWAQKSLIEKVKLKIIFKLDKKYKIIN